MLSTKQLEVMYRRNPEKLAELYVKDNCIRYRLSDLQFHEGELNSRYYAEFRHAVMVAVPKYDRSLLPLHRHCILPKDNKIDYTGLIRAMGELVTSVDYASAVDQLENITSNGQGEDNPDEKHRMLLRALLVGYGQRVHDTDMWQFGIPALRIHNLACTLEQREILTGDSLHNFWAKVYLANLTHLLY